MTTALAQAPAQPAAPLIAVALAAGGALHALAAHKAFLIYELVPKADQPGKMDKVPRHPASWRQRDQLLSAEDARLALPFLLADYPHGGGIGFVFHEDDPFFFLDADACYDPASGAWTELATRLAQRLPGAAFEVSSSGTGMHLFGTCAKPFEHGCRNTALGIELYTEGRFVALTGTSAQGDAGTNLDGAIRAIAAEYFPPSASTGAAPVEWEDKARPNWNGPEDDDALLALAKARTPSLTAAEAFGGAIGKASFAQLWECDKAALAAIWPSSGSEGDGVDHSSADMALASHLAFWTGCNPTRMERLMRESGLAREKWDRGGYLGRTIEKAIGDCSSVYGQRAATAEQQAPRPLVPDEPTPSAAYPVEALPPVMRDAALAIAEHVQAPLALAAQCVIGAAAHLAQTRINAPHIHNPDGMPASLFILTLADSGDRKSECRRLAFRVVDDAEREARTTHRQACAVIEAEAAQHRGKKREEYQDANPLPADPRTQYSDATFEPIAGDMIRGTAAASWDTDEGGQMLGGASLKADTRTATIGGLCKAFDAGHFERTRSRANLEGSGFAYNRRLSVHLLAQSVAVAEALHDPLLRGQGFLPRFLFAAPVSLAGTRLLTAEQMGRKSWADPRLQAYWERCRAIQASHEHIDRDTSEVRPPVLALAAEGEVEWRAFYNEVEGEQGALGQYAGLRPFAGRAGELARRVAAVLAFFEGRDRIDGEAMRNACAIVRHSLEEWLRYTDRATVDPDRQQAAKLLEWLRDPKRADTWLEFHRDKLGKSGPPATRSAQRRDKLLAILVEHRHLTTSDGKQFRLAPPADSADSAESQ